MKILMIVSDFYDTGHGGVEGHVLGITRSLTRQGHQVIILRNADRPIIRPDYDPGEDGVDYRVLGSASTQSRGWAKRVGAGRKLGLATEFVRRLVSGRRSASTYREVLELVGPVDVVHQHNFLEGRGLTTRFAKAGTRVVWTNHLGEFLYIRRMPLLGAPVLRGLTRHYCAAAAPSGELADASAISAPVRLIPNGVDTERFRPVSDATERRELRSRLGWPTDRQVVIIPRRWAPTKGVVYAAHAMTLATWPAEAYVVFAGSGTEEYPGYAAEIRAHLSTARSPFEIHQGVAQAVMAEMLRAADVCLVPSVKEATSLSALEAMASGTVVAAARVGGLPEIVIDGQTGFLHEPKDPASIASTVARALAHLGVGDHARQFACDGYSWDVIAGRTAQMYEEAP